jgi:hypothetical protein
LYQPKNLTDPLDLLKNCITFLGDFSDVRAIISAVLLSFLGWQLQKEWQRHFGSNIF